MTESSQSPSSPDHRLGRRQFLLTSARALAAAGIATVSPRALTAGDIGSAHAEMLAAVCGRIIPRTDTPGAIEARVPEFIADVLSNVYLPSESQQFAVRLTDMADQVQQQTGKTFIELTPGEQDVFLQSMESAEDTTSAEFFAELRLLTVYGYYTSEAGATSEHALTNYMAPWNGDMPYADVGRMWSG